MTPEQKAAFINSQTAMLYVELEEMKVANFERERQGYAQAYDDGAFADLFKRYEPILGYNSVLGVFRE